MRFVPRGSRPRPALFVVKGGPGNGCQSSERALLRVHRLLRPSRRVRSPPRGPSSPRPDPRVTPPNTRTCHVHPHDVVYRSPQPPRAHGYEHHRTSSTPSKPKIALAVSGAYQPSMYEALPRHRPLAHDVVRQRLLELCDRVLRERRDASAVGRLLLYGRPSSATSSVGSGDSRPIRRGPRRLRRQTTGASSADLAGRQSARSSRDASIRGVRDGPAAVRRSRPRRGPFSRGGPSSEGRERALNAQARLRFTIRPRFPKRAGLLETSLPQTRRRESASCNSFGCRGAELDDRGDLLAQRRPLVGERAVLSADRLGDAEPSSGQCGDFDPLRRVC